MNDDYQILLDNGYHPVFDEYGICLMEPGTAYKVYFRGNANRNWQFSNDNIKSYKKVNQDDILTFLYKEKADNSC